MNTNPLHENHLDGVVTLSASMPNGVKDIYGPPTPAAKLSPLFCDKISVTFKPEPGQAEKIDPAVLGLIEDHHARKVHKPMYALSAEIDVSPPHSIPGSAWLLVQCQPKANRSYFRCEFNPSKVDLTEVRQFLDHIVPGGYPSLIKRGVCTRIDLTVDVSGVAIDDLLLSHPNFSKSSGFYGCGCTETYYIGTSKSPRRFCFYDKLAETKRNNLTQLVKEPLPEVPMTRIEVRLGQDPYVAELASLENPFVSLQVASYNNDSAYGNEAFQMFLDSCRWRGAQDALLRLSPRTRKKFRQRLAEGSSDWWRPAELWAQWPEVFRNITNPGKPSYSLNVPKSDVIGPSQLVGPHQAGGSQAKTSKCN
jgi:hypothetical protein